MSTEIIYTDGACSGNGTARSIGGYGIYIAKSKLFDSPIKINRKGEHMIYEDNTYYITNIRMEGLAIVSTLALYANYNSKNVIDTLNQNLSFDLVPETNIKLSQDSIIEIVTDSQFWINVVELWMPNWIRKGILLEKKNPDILLLIHNYMEFFRNNNIKIKFTHVKSHQKGKRSYHADGNDVADVLATTAINNQSNAYFLQ